jgi:hypothetical protein
VVDARPGCPGVLLVAVVVGLAWRGRDGFNHRPGPVTYFLYGLSLVCLVIVLVGTGIGIHAAAHAIGPTSPAPDFSDSLPFQPCSTGDTSAPSTTIPPDQLPCIDFGQSGQSESGLIPAPDQSSPDSSSTASGSAVGYASLVADGSDRNQYISAAVIASLFALAGLIGYLVVWPRSRRNGSESGADRRGIKQFAVAYGYLVAALSAVLLLIFVPLAVDNAFRAIAPGVNNASGHADGIRGLVTFAVLSGLATIGLVYHLRYANRLREPPPPTSEA